MIPAPSGLEILRGLRDRDDTTPVLVLTALGAEEDVQSLHAVVESEGLVVRVSEAELEHARMQLGELEGTWTDLASAAPVAAAIKLAQRGDVPSRTLVVPVLTQHGALDGSSVAAGTLETVDARVDELLRVLAVRGE